MVLASITISVVWLASPDGGERMDYRLRKWPGDLKSIPCEAWKKSTTSAWELNASWAWEPGDLRGGDLSLLPESAEWQIIEKKCGRKDRGGAAGCSSAAGSAPAAARRGSRRAGCPC